MNRAMGSAAAAVTTKSPTPDTTDAQKAVERTFRDAVSACTRAAPMPMSATVGANAASTMAIAAAP